MEQPKGNEEKELDKEVLEGLAWVPQGKRQVANTTLAGCCGTWLIMLRLLHIAFRIPFAERNHKFVPVDSGGLGSETRLAFS